MKGIFVIQNPRRAGVAILPFDLIGFQCAAVREVAVALERRSVLAVRIRWRRVAIWIVPKAT